MSATMTSAEIARRGQEIYDRDLRSQVEDEHRGEFLVLDIQTGDYEIAARDVIASNRLLTRRPEAILFRVRIGSPAAYRLGGHWGPTGS